MKLEELLQNEEFCKRLERAENKQEILDVFREAGVIDPENEIKEKLKATGAEMTEDDLEQVAGGMIDFRGLRYRIMVLLGWKF